MATITIKLGKRPETLHRIVKVEMPDGSTGVIEVDFVYRTRREFAALIDENVEFARASTGEGDAGSATSRITESAIKTNANYLGEILKGWSLDAELNDESLEQLCDEMPGVAQAVIDAYRIAITEGRSGN